MVSQRRDIIFHTKFGFKVALREKAGNGGHHKARTFLSNNGKTTGEKPVAFGSEKAT